MSDRRTHWQKIYADESPSGLSWYQERPERSLQLIRDSAIDKGDALIDVGGGASRLVDYLSGEGFTNLSVLDISGHALARAKSRLGRSAAAVQWIEADITEFRTQQRYGLWHDRAVFHFLTDPLDRQKYLDVLTRTLRPQGHLVIAAFAPDGPEKCSGLAVERYDAPRLMAVLGEDFQLLGQARELHVTPANKEQRFMYFHLVKCRAKEPG